MTERSPLSASRAPAGPPSPRRARGLAFLAAVVVVLVVAAIAVAVAPAPDEGTVGGPSPTPTGEPLVPGPPVPPAGVVAAAEPFAVRLRWDADATAEVERYLVFRNGTEIADVPATDPGELVDDGVAPGARYVYAVVAVGPTGLTSGPTEVPIETPPASLAAARLEGAFDVAIREGSGAGGRGGWTFRPGCRRGACDVTVLRVFRRAEPIELAKRAATYRARGRTDLGIRCAGTPIRSSFSLRLTVVRADTVAGRWRATAIEGRLVHREPRRPRCDAARGTLDLRGRLVDLDAPGAG